MLINIFLYLTICIYGKTGGITILRQLRTDIDNSVLNQSEKKIKILYLCEPHLLPAYSIILKNVDLRLIDTSPLRKLEGFDEIKELINDPLSQYKKICQDGDPDYVIIQERYAMTGAKINPSYSFLL